MTPHEQKSFNDALHKKAVAETQLRLASMVHRYFDHELVIKLSKAKQKDQMPMLFDLEKALKKVLV